MGRAQVHVTTSEPETEALGRNLAHQAGPHGLILLFGDLGAGKTAFVRGLADGIGADPDDVSSPTFTVMQEYRGRTILRHVDLYRLASGFDVDELALDELALDALVAVEWAERLDDVPADAWVVRIAIGDEDERTIRIEPAST